MYFLPVDYIISCFPRALSSWCFKHTLPGVPSCCTDSNQQPFSTSLPFWVSKSSNPQTPSEPPNCRVRGHENHQPKLLEPNRLPGDLDVSAAERSFQVSGQRTFHHRFDFCFSSKEPYSKKQICRTRTRQKIAPRRCCRLDTTNFTYSLYLLLLLKQHP